MALSPNDRAETPGATLVVDGLFAWRRTSEEEWHAIQSTELVDPQSDAANADDALGQCATSLIREIMDLP